MASATHAPSSDVTGLVIRALAGAVTIRRCAEFTAAVRSERWTQRRLTGLPLKQELNGHPRIVCVVPMYQEQAIVAETVHFWAGASKDPLIHQVVLVTTAKETAPSSHPFDDLDRPEHAAQENRVGQQGRTTAELVDDELRGLGVPSSQVRHVHCPEVTPYRASQLNHAVAVTRRELGSELGDPRDLWIGIYNADSRPEASTFTELVAHAAAEPDTRVFQQLADYLVPDRAGTTLAATGNALHQTWWTCAHYWPRNRRGTKPANWYSRTTSYSTFGHGEFIRLDFLDDVDGFPSFAYADGLLLGWIVRLRDEPLGLLASRDLAEVPRTATDLFTQQRAWMRGLLNYEGTVRWARQHGHLNLTRAETTALRLIRILSTTSWGLSTPAIGIALALTARRILNGPTDRSTWASLVALLAYPVLPAVLNVRGDHQTSLARRAAAAALIWPVEGLAFGHALADSLRTAQDPPAKTPR